MGHPSKLPASESVAAAAGGFPGSLLRTDRLSGPAPGGPGQLWVFLKARFIGINSPFKRMWKRQEQCYDFLAMEHRDFMIRIYGDLCGDMTI